jgi:hypothetical protein
MRIRQSELHVQVHQDSQIYNARLVLEYHCIYGVHFRLA